jgi:hypothetical protein
MRLPAAHRFAVAVTVYTVISIIGGGYLYTPMGL